MNPRRVLAVLAAAAAAVILILRIPGADDSAPPAGVITTSAAPAAAAAATVVANPTTAATTSAPAAATTQADDIDDDSIFAPDPPASVDTAGAAATADRFARAWTRHTGAAGGDWARRLAALSTPTLAGKLRVIDPAVVPADKVTGAAQLTVTPGGADARVATDRGTLQLTLIHQGRWLVDTLDWTPRR